MTEHPSIRINAHWRRNMLFNSYLTTATTWVTLCLSGALLTLMALSNAHASEQVPTGPITSADVPNFLDKARCIACHEQSRTRVGPPWNAISARYANASPEEIDILASKIIAGGGGNWGTVPMISNPEISKDQARVVVRWILALKTSAKDTAENTHSANAQAGSEQVGSAIPTKQSHTVLMEHGKEIYSLHCAVCHQSNGTGLPPTFPSLVRSKVVMGSPQEHI